MVLFAEILTASKRHVMTLFGAPVLQIFGGVAKKLQQTVICTLRDTFLLRTPTVKVHPSDTSI